jgi:hypothetical protein
MGNRGSSLKGTAAGISSNDGIGLFPLFEGEVKGRTQEVKMKKTWGAILILLGFSLAVTLFIHPKRAEGTVSVVRLSPEDIKEVLYKVNIRTVTVELNREVNEVSRLAFVEYGKLEALQLMELLTSQRGLVASVDPDRGFVFDYGFVGLAE